MKKFVLLFIIGCVNTVFSQADNLVTNLTTCGTNGSGVFNLNNATTQALLGYNPSNFQVNFYLTLGDLNANSNPISNTNNFANTTNPQTIYMKIVNTISSEVITKNFDLEVIDNPLVTILTQDYCDYNFDASESIYNGLSSFNGVFITNNNYTINYYESYANAFNSVNPLNQLDPYIINGFGSHTLYVRVQKANVDCYSISTLILNLNNCSESGLPQDMYVCLPDNCFNFSYNTSAIINTLNPTNYQVSYYLTQNDAEANTNPIINSTNFCTVTNQIIYASLYNILTNTSQVFSFNITLNDCTEPPIPGNFYAILCVDIGGTLCVDLTTYNTSVIGTLNPTSYSISYHLSIDEATTNTNAIVTPFCQGEGYYTIYSRITNISDPTQYFIATNILQLNTYAFLGSSAYLFSCDDNDDGIVSLNLIDSESQVGFTNLTYYTNQSDALDQINPISNPTIYSVGALTSSSVFGRYNQTGDCDFIFEIILNTIIGCSNPFECLEANSLCGSLGEPFVNNQYTAYDEPGADYGCLSSHPNPIWFYMQASQNGTINLKIEQNTSSNFDGQLLDVDYIIYGPFSNPTSGCAQLTSGNIVSCSYSAQSTEFPIVPNTITGQYYLIMVTNFSNQYGFIRITDLNPNLGALECSGIRMHAFVDANSNAIKDAGELNFPLGKFHYEKNDSGIIHDIISDTGEYTFYDTNETNTYTLEYSLNTNLTSFYNLTTSNYSDIIVNQGAGVQNYYFPIISTQNYEDLSVAIVPISSPRAGLTYISKIIYSNLGNQTMPSGTITFNHDAVLTITNITQAGTTAIPNGFTYNFSNLLPYETRYFYVTMQVPTFPTVILNQIVNNSATITLTESDFNQENNESSLSQIVLNAYDPNDKIESHGGRIVHSTFATSDYLYYTIRFENTGNANAINVKLTDLLDSKLEESTFQVVNASDSFIVDQVGSIVTILFRNIQLPVSVPDTQIGHGYITFKIKPKAGYAVGDIIPNTANIYFDFNPAIVTNTYTTEFVATLGNTNFAFGNFSYYPNPVKNSLFISNTSTIDSIEITSVLGQTMLSKKVNELQTEINLSELSNGIYFVKVTSEGEEKTVKVIKE